MRYLDTAQRAHVGDRIREARKGFGTHDRLAEAVGTSRQHLIKLEKGQHAPGETMLARIAEATGRDVAWFMPPEVGSAAAPFPGEQAA